MVARKIGVRAATGRGRGREAERQRDRETERQRDRETERQRRGKQLLLVRHNVAR
jgi:hypothetical protein